MFNMDPSKTLIGYLVRHGELTNPNVWDGWGSLDLSEEGRQQAEKVAQWLSFEKIGRVVSSDLPRAIHTAEYIMDTGVVECSYLTCEPNLRPRGVGTFTGKEKTPERLADFQKYLDDPDLVVPEGESQTQLRIRAQVIYQYLVAPYKALPTVCVIHNSVIKALLGLDDQREVVGNGGVIAVYMDEKGEVSFQIVLGESNKEKGVS
jgi:broad specificity phosphatase PhoE